ncbi:cytochrome P450 [Aspergillus flavus]|uniref:Cytochrome P450 n=1 Tax=Aspergillus flavus TaxID=5059 RepID=A0A5N6GP61_ASPFL|nr:cytochrome P450 [Aspergillus flavus]
MDFVSFLHQENFKGVLETDLLQLGVSSALLGVLLHITIFRRVALLTTLFNTSLNTSITAKNIQYNVELKRLHKQYGDFVRTALSVYEPRVIAQAKKLIALVEANQGKPLDAITWSMLFTFDIMGDIGFGAAAGYQGFFKWCTDQVETKRKVLSPRYAFGLAVDETSVYPDATQQSWDHDKYPQDIISWILKAFIDNDVSAPPSEPALHDDSRVVVIAGSLRLRPSVSGGGYRVTPAEGLQIDEVFIPGDVNVFVPQQLIQTDERYYKFSKEFIPERWGEKKVEWGTDKAPYFLFSLAVSTLAQRYDIRFRTGDILERCIGYIHHFSAAFASCVSPKEIVNTTPFLRLLQVFFILHISGVKVRT